MKDNTHTNVPLQLLKSDKLTYICAPMVRYSKLVIYVW